MSIKKKASLIITAVASLLLLLTGTFAWVNFNQSVINEFKGTGDISEDTGGATLHDDFEDPNKDVYIENWGDTVLYVRLRLSEYMEMGKGAGLKGDLDSNGVMVANPGNKASSLIATADINDVKTWTPHKPDSEADICGIATHEYWDWEMGGWKYYIPAPEAARMDSGYVDQNNGVFDENTLGARRTDDATVITMAQWQALGYPIGESYWVVDTDGWAYWTNPLQPGEATGLLLNAVNLAKNPKEDYYYAINVHAQMATKDGDQNYKDFYNDFDDDHKATDDGKDLLDRLVNGGDDDNSATVTGIEVTKDPNKMNYQAGDTFDPSGMEITVALSDGSTEVIPSSDFASKGVTVSAPSPLTQGSNSVTISYRGKQTTLGITIGAPEVASIAVTKNPSKMTYQAGDAFEPAGMEITVTRTDNSTEVIPYSQFASKGVSVTAPNPLAQGANSVEISYSGKETTLTVNAGAVPVVVTGISVTKNPTKMTYQSGDAFEPAGMEITVTKSDNSTEVIPYSQFASKGVTITAPTALVQGDNTVLFSYSGKETSLNVSAGVAAIQSIAVKTPPQKTAYQDGDSFDPAGLVITVTRTDGSREDVPYSASNASDFEFSPDPLAQGQTSVTIGYKNAASTQQPITVGSGVLNTIVTEFKPDHTNGTDAEKTLYENGIVSIDGYGVPMQFDTAYWGSLDKCYGYIPLSYFLNGDTSGVTVYSVSNLPGQGSSTGLNGIEIGNGADLSRRTAGTDLRGQNCIILKWLPSTLKGAIENEDIDYYYDVTVRLQKGNSITENLTIRLTYSGMVDNDKLD